MEKTEEKLVTFRANRGYAEGMECEPHSGKAGPPATRQRVCRWSLLAAAVMMPAAGAEGGELKIRRIIDICPVWSGHRVGFSLLTRGKRQYAAFYDDQRRMTVAARGLDADTWQLVRLPERLGWDSHNYVTLAVDDDGRIHLSGNLHCHPLKYFRTSRPGDVTSFERIDRMVGRQERRATYPRFFRGAADELIFTYRDGGSGNGNQIYNVYDDKARAWRRLLDSPLTDGRGRMNAYLRGPVRGPDGYFHLCWVWRDTPDCATNHDLSYARSKDLIHWLTADGGKVKLPMTLETPGLIVDPVPVKGGMINGNTKVGFDTKGRVIISYHKFDADGKTQLYNARLEQGAWKIYRTSDWGTRWDFRGRGSIVFEISLGGVRIVGGRLVQSYRHARHGSGGWVLDEATLKPTGKATAGTRPPAKLNKAESTFPGMTVRWRADSGGGEPGTRYRLRWETLPSNRDRPRKPPLPKPSMLRLYELLAAEAGQ